MQAELQFIITFMVEAFLKIWPYLLITIPIAVAVNLSGASKHINRAFNARPIAAIFLATFVGAFSPFCSCTVIPIVASLLIGGVPLAPVMAFWIASPSMDPEIFFLSVAMLGWDLALWRVGATLLLSIAAGFITLGLSQRGWLGDTILRTQTVPETTSTLTVLQRGWTNLKQSLKNIRTTSSSLNIVALPISLRPADSTPTSPEPACTADTCAPVPTESASCCGDTCSPQKPTFWQNLLTETWAATKLVFTFMLLAFFIEALIVRYLPSAWVVTAMGPQNPLAILTAALVGVPLYTTNLAALPMIGGLLEQGMSPGAALAFLIAGPTTTLPAMAAVWGLTTRRVFLLYVSFSLIGAIVLGAVYQWVQWG